MKILSMSRTFKETVEEREDQLDTWILKREKMSTSQKGFFDDRTKNIFEFAYQYDIPNIFRNDFYSKLPPEFRKEAFEGPAESIKKQFPIFFRLVDHSRADAILHLMVPKQYVNGTEVISRGEYSPGLWFILGGSVKATHTDNKNVDLLEYKKGSIFGDVCLLNRISDRSFV